MGTKQTAEFRQEVVRVALASGLGRKQVASDFGIGFSTLSVFAVGSPSGCTIFNALHKPQHIDFYRINLKIRREILKLFGK